MIALKFFSVATLLALSVGCHSSGSADSNGMWPFARHEGISRTFVHGCTVEARQSSPALANDDTSRTYDNCCPLVADDTYLRRVNDDTSRTFHLDCQTYIDEHGTFVGDSKLKRTDTQAVCACQHSKGAVVAGAHH